MKFLIRNLVLAFALAVSSTAHAGAVLDGSNDRIDIGTVGNFGSSIKAAAGWSLMCWLKTSQTSVSSVLINFTQGAQGVTGAAHDQAIMWSVQTKWTTDFASNANSVLLDMGDENDEGLLWWHTLTGITIGDGVLHHHAITVIATGNLGANNNSGATITSYQDGTASAVGWTKPFSDGLGTVGDFSNSVAIGAELKNGGTWFDWTAGTFVDCRVYTVALTANEINEIYQGKGSDSVTHSLLRRWPLIDSGCSEYMAGTKCVPQNGPTWAASYELNGIRRR